MKDWQVYLLQLVVKVGLDAALSIAKAIQTSPNIDEAIVALEKAQAKTWDDYKREAGVVQ